MKKAPLAALIFLLLLIPTFVNIPKVRATTTEDLWVTYALPDDVPREPMPENFTTEDYLNTTNPYSNLASAQGALDEVDDPEGSNPLYVLVFGDEEERPVIRSDYVGNWFTWDNWAKWQIERGDESLVANFGIDIRILGFLEWDSNDSKDSMYDLWDELEADTGQHLRQWYDGEWWSNYVDAIIGITAQETTDNIAGLSSGDDYLDAGRVFILLRWQVYWADDNLVQHEVSHLYYAPDQPEPQPPAPCCAMAYHPHYQSWIWEDGLWWVFNDIPCAYTAYSWCTSCSQTIQQNSGRYPLRTLTISASSGGTTNPTLGTYIYGNGESVTVTATAYMHYVFDYWLLDGATVYGNPITTTMDADHNLEAYFKWANSPPNTPSTPSGPTSGYRNVWYTYSTSTIDPNGDNVRYEFEFAGPSTNVSFTTGWYASGQTGSLTVMWETTDPLGTYYVRARAQDVYDAWSGYSSSLTVTIGSGGGCPMLFVWDGTDYVCEGLLDIHNPEGIDVVYQHTLVTTPQRVHGAYLFRLVEHPQTHSYIDQVKLYAILEDGTMVELPLIRARHLEYGNVLPHLLFSDDWKTETLGANLNNGTSQSIDLKFIALPPNMNSIGFIFQIEGNNPFYKV
jgi:hypothetical protein